ncbi:hypothetical protein GH714_016163 [Hevea brasiliensis]|uniref:adenylate kinase n=1 Tax=Hevea brasiliensis TaxID=3981 RepID=A0A6A6KPH3_HEVBR|nr:hypothetical protein GH714_016163 [Hevea brasiliensis]
MGDMKEETSEMVIGEHAIETVSVDKTTNNEFVSENTTTELEFSEKETFDEILSENKTVESVCAKETKEAVPEETAKETVTEKKLVVVFVLGGPGGERVPSVLRSLKKSAILISAVETYFARPLKATLPMIEAMIKEGKSVPPDITMEILQKAIEESGNDKFILDGFPRDEEIRAAFESATKTEPELVLFFECSEEERERRILSRNQGRVDDNSESVRKRFRYFQEHTLPVVDYYKRKGLVLQIDAGRPEKEVFETLKSILGPSTTMQAEEAPITEELGKKISELGL